MKKFSTHDLIAKLLAALLGYFAGLYGLVNLPAPGLNY